MRRKGVRMGGRCIAGPEFWGVSGGEESVSRGGR